MGSYWPGRGGGPDGSLYARASSGDVFNLGGDLLGSPHRYRINWTPTGFDFMLMVVQPLPRRSRSLFLPTCLFRSVMSIPVMEFICGLVACIRLCTFRHLRFPCI